jgi:hypothetical protein
LLKATPEGVTKATLKEVFAPFPHMLETNRTLKSLEICYLSSVYEEGGEAAIVWGLNILGAALFLSVLLC